MWVYEVKHATTYNIVKFRAGKYVVEMRREEFKKTMG